MEQNNNTLSFIQLTKSILEYYGTTKKVKQKENRKQNAETNKEQSAGSSSLIDSEGKINTPQFKQASKPYEGKSSYK